jgi:hypothetical protein
LARSAASLDIPARRSRIIWKSSRTKALVKVKRDGTFLWYTANTDALKELLGFSTPSAAPATRRQARRSHRADLQIGENHDHSSRHQGSRQGKIRPGGAAVQNRRKLLLRRLGAQRADGCCDPITSTSTTPPNRRAAEEAVLASLGCGNPTALAELNPGETVLDLGSGGGIDVLLSARRVGPPAKPTAWT